MISIAWLRAGLAALSCVAFGCGGGPSISTGLPRNQTVNTLTAADMKTACLNTLDRFKQDDDAVRSGCAARLLLDGEAACNAGLESCVSASKAAQEEAASAAYCDQSGSTDTSKFLGCSATVGEFEDCLSESYDRGVALYSGITCASPRPMPSTLDPFSGPKCSPLLAKCPTIFATDEPAR